MGSVVKAEVGEMEENTREGRSSRVQKYVVGCVGGEDILSPIRRWAEAFLCSKEEVEMDEPLSNSQEKEQGELLIIDGNPEVG